VQAGEEKLMKRYWDIVIIGSGPAGMAAALGAGERGARVCVIEREDRPGGILKQCIHDGFGLLRFKEKLSGPEYAHRYLQMLREKQVPVWTGTFLLEIARFTAEHGAGRKHEGEKITDKNAGFQLTFQNSQQGIFSVNTRAVIYAAGCRERTARQVFIHGTRPAGVLTAGTAQYMVNLQGYLPVKKCVILGSGDIGLIMARRLSLEGAQVEGVYEIKPEPSGLTRNVVQCLEDFNIPIYLSSTVTKVHGKNRVSGVTVSGVDNDFNPLSGTERYVSCDGLVVSAGLIPENDMLESLGVRLDLRTGGPWVDQFHMTSVEGLFVCGNALHVNDLVDYVSESGRVAGEAAAGYALGYINKLVSQNQVTVNPGPGINYVVPQWLNLAALTKITRENKSAKLVNQEEPQVTFFFRSQQTVYRPRLEILSRDTGVVLHEERYPVFRPAEMQKVKITARELDGLNGKLELRLREVET